jgi:hypothetical protein
MARRARNILLSLASPALCVLLLLGMIAEARTRIQPADAEPYHARVRDAVDAVPVTLQIGGGWVSTDTPVPTEATKLLRPNNILSREYSEQSTNGEPRPLRKADLLIVACRDARDLQGHYPKNCYVANGQTLVSAARRTWTVEKRDSDGNLKKDANGDIEYLNIDGTEYLFDASHSSQNGRDLRRVYNFFVIPAIPHLPARAVRGICPDIDAVYKSGEDYQRRYYGASEFQVVISDDVSQEQRDDAFRQIITECTPAIETMLNENADKNPTRGPQP